MPQYLSNLFTARRPLDPVPAMPQAKYKTLHALFDEHRSIDDIFSGAAERIKQIESEQSNTADRKPREDKETKKQRLKEEQVKKHRESLKQASEQCKYP